MRLSDQTIRGLSVIGADGQALGVVGQLFLDSDTWRVESIQVKLARDVADQIGASHNLFRAGAVEVPVRLIQSVGDAVVLTVSADGLREVLPPEQGELHAH